jgi:hypothetical protein
VISEEYLESDLFFCFNNLMIELRDGFIRDLDKEKNGIWGRVDTFAQVLKVVEPECYKAIEQNNVNH